MIPGKMFSCFLMSIPYSDWRARSNDCFLLKFIFLRRIVNPGRDGQIRYLDVSGCKVVTPSMERLSKADDLFSANVEALADEEIGGNYKICYSESVVKVGYTYYDCGPCTKVYDEKGRGRYSKCFK